MGKVKVEKKDPAAELAVRLVDSLRQQKATGVYPLTVKRLGELTDPLANEDLVAKATTKKPFIDEVILPQKKNPDAPVVLIEDEAVLADSPELLEFALNQLVTPSGPLVALDKVVKKVDKSLQDAFKSA